MPRAVSSAAWARADWLALAAVVLAAAALRFSGLAHPAAFVFDETYYVPAACRLALGPRPECGGPSPYDLHPPLGKWLIAAGIAAAGLTPVGWRIAAAVAGTLTVGLLFVTARRLLHSTLSATVAAGLLALDLLHFVHSRIGMLDAFLVLFAVAALLCWSLDRDRVDDRVTPGWRYGLFTRPWRIATGLAAGAAIATKWPGALVAATTIGLALLTDIPRMPRSGDGRVSRADWGREAASVAAWLVALPLLVYALTHAWTIRGALLTWPWAEGAWVRALIEEQLRLLRLHPAVANAHPLRTEPWLWFSSPLHCPTSSDASGRRASG
ncbi:MAG: phospholipid carrier-dependent glycosyltransferase [Armatimonadota bacterium]|nr:phospholipid carrier-dependent glycosyltransferase [Armatimonadota bacterium]MDR7486828.1 phospholipid carrier-dependent glycosyltransferase [Armatimonadota bacterium]MDR7532978.1 phospholipid carrier-dependent glycosyltransferase [Armatimonadota bacterium]